MCIVHCNGGPDRVCVEGRNFCAREALLLLKCTAVPNNALRYGFARMAYDWNYNWMQSEARW